MFRHQKFKYASNKHMHMSACTHTHTHTHTHRHRHRQTDRQTDRQTEASQGSGTQEKNWQKKKEEKQKQTRPLLSLRVIMNYRVFCIHVRQIFCNTNEQWFLNQDGGSMSHCAVGINSAQQMSHTQQGMLAWSEAADIVIIGISLALARTLRLKQNVFHVKSLMSGLLPAVVIFMTWQASSL